MVGVDDADAAVLVYVVAAKEQFAHLEAQLPGGMSRRVPDLQGLVADGNGVAFIEENIDLARGHRDLNALCLDGFIGDNLVAGLDWLDAERVGRDLGAHQVTGTMKALDVVGVRVRGDDHLARRQVEVHLPDQLDDLLDGVVETDVDKDELTAAVDEVDIDAESSPGLVIQLDDAGEEVFARLHEYVPPWRRLGKPEAGIPGCNNRDMRRSRQTGRVIR